MEALNRRDFPAKMKKYEGEDLQIENYEKKIAIFSAIFLFHIQK